MIRVVTTVFSAYNVQKKRLMWKRLGWIILARTYECSAPNFHRAGDGVSGRGQGLAQVDKIETVFSDTTNSSCRQNICRNMEKLLPESKTTR